ncbi:MAG TPA: hypothetical protein VGS79_09170 [Puia sp.]|nr:hypothetical protein [Puia sp.]
MEKAAVIALLERYWQAETTIAEEQTLAAYFQGGHVDPGLEAYRDVFSYFHEEAQVSAGPDFGNRILQRLGLPLDGEDAGAGVPVHGQNPATGPDASAHEAPVVPMTRQPFRLGVMGAAAAIVLIVAGLFLLRPIGQPTMLADTRVTSKAQDTPRRADIADTYDDPQQALAAVRRALLVASRNLNQGRREISGTSK